MLNIASGGAAINALARQVGADVWVTNVGVATDTPEHPAIRDRLVRRGTRDLSVEPAMTTDETIAALEVGIATANEAVDGGADVLLTGEMGIGNTTAAAALISAFTGADAGVVAGRGAGADSEMMVRKVAVIRRALALHRASVERPLETRPPWGLEHAALAGFIVGGAARRVPVVLDGVIAASAALAATALAPAARGYLISGHAGMEPGITEAMRHLGLRPLLDLDLRLGEGSGAAMALPVVKPRRGC